MYIHDGFVAVFTVTGIVVGCFISRYFKSQNINWITASFLVVGLVISLIAISILSKWNDSSTERRVDFRRACLRRAGYLKYVYKPLDKADSKSIRLIELLALNKADGEDAIHDVRIRMRVASLRDVHAEKYEALSYCWGDSSCLQPIICDGAVILVTANLFMALHRVRVEGRNKILWVDALCINQEDLEEKNWQVRMMSEVYSNATRVLIYLGEEKDFSELLEELLPQLSKAKNEIRLELDNGTISSDTRLTTERQQELGIPLLTRSSALMLLALQRLFLREWFRRIWIVQEITLAQDATVFCGDWQLQWTSLLAAYDMASVLSVSSRDMLDLGFSRLKRISWSRDNKNTSLVNFLYVHRGAGATNPRDHIYALLGLAGDRKGFEVDYTKSVAQIYCDAARQILSSSRQLRLLNIAGNARHQSDLRLPSWVPDWRADMVCVDLWDHSRETMLVDLEFTPDESQLNLHGVEIDSISQLSICFPLLRTGTEYSPWYELRCGWSIHDCIKTFRPSPTTPYPIGEASTLDVFWQVLTDGKFRQELQSLRWERIRMFMASWLAYLPVSTNSFLQQISVYLFLWAPPFLLLNLCRKLSTSKKWQIIQHSDFTIGRRMFRTEKNFIGLAPADTRKGDKVFLLHGGLTPMVLRRSMNDQDAYELVGECYLHGFMDKQAADVGECYKVSLA